jgi:serine/threonine protein kinase
MLKRGLTWISGRINAGSDDGGVVLETKASALIRQRSSWTGTRQGGDLKAFKDDFTMEEVLGEGAFGVVHHVIRRADKAEFAAKVVARASKESQEEVRVWSALSSPFHPSILPLLEMFEDPGTELALLTEVMHGGDLTDAVFNVEMSEQACRLMCVQIASAVAYLHCVHSFAHRDLKPHNLLSKEYDPTQIGSIKVR